MTRRGLKRWGMEGTGSVSSHPHEKASGRLAPQRRAPGVDRNAQAMESGASTLRICHGRPPTKTSASCSDTTERSTRPRSSPTGAPGAQEDSRLWKCLSPPPVALSMRCMGRCWMAGTLQFASLDHGALSSSTRACHGASCGLLSIRQLHTGPSGAGGGARHPGGPTDRLTY